MKNKLIIMCFLLALFSCKGMEEKKPRWQPVVSTPENYPVTVFGGALTYSEKGGEHIMYATYINNSWGSIGGAFYARSSSFAPDGLGVRWYSFADDKFYQDFFDLPYDTIKQLFDAGFISSETKLPDNFRYIVVGLAPGGIVNVWLNGDGISVEVGSFKAKEADLNLIREIPSGMKDYYEGYTKDSARIEWRESLLSNKTEPREAVEAYKGDLDGIWDKLYREKFDSRVVVNFADKNAIIDMMTMHFINGEAESLMYDKMKENPFSKKARFTYVEFEWSYNRELRLAKLYLDEAEILEAYKLIFEGEGNVKQAELRIDVNESNSYIRVYLQAVGTEYPKEVELEKSDIGIHPISESYRFRFDVFRHEYKDGVENRMERKDSK